MLGLIVICADEGTGLAPHALLEPLLGAPLLARGAAAGLPTEDGVAGVIVVAAELVERVKHDVVVRFGLDEFDNVVAGGPDRKSALRAGLAALPVDVDVVIVQEAARVLVPVGLVDRVVAAARSNDVAVAAVPPADAVVVDEGGTLVALDVRPQARLLQGPAAFKVATLKAVLEAAGGTSGAGEVEDAARAGAHVALVAGDDDNRLLRDATDVSRALEVFARRAADYVFVYPADLLPDDPLQKALDPSEARTAES